MNARRHQGCPKFGECRRALPYPVPRAGSMILFNSRRGLLGGFAAELDGDVGLRSQSYDFLRDVLFAKSAVGVFLEQACCLCSRADDSVHQTSFNNEERHLLVNNTRLGCCKVRHAASLVARRGFGKRLGLRLVDNCRRPGAKSCGAAALTTTALRQAHKSRRRFRIERGSSRCPNLHSPTVQFVRQDGI